MAACGRAEELAALMAAAPTAVSTEGGPHGWAPLLCLCYSRLHQDNALGTLAVLLRAGADPNAGFLWKGLTSPFTALTGVLGGGERGEPPHAECVRLATVLLDAGADPNDNQTLYNRAFRPDDSHLPPMLAGGLGGDRPSPWRPVRVGLPESAGDDRRAPAQRSRQRVHRARAAAAGARRGPEHPGLPSDPR